MTQSTAKHIPFAIHHETQGELTNRRTMSAATEQGNFFKICNSMYMRCTENSDVYWRSGLRRVGKHWHKDQREWENQVTKLALGEEDSRVKLL